MKPISLVETKYHIEDHMKVNLETSRTILQQYGNENLRIHGWGKL